jgi:hypothetical protein
MNHSVALPYPRISSALKHRGKETNFKNKFKAGHWWLMPVILATQEAVIRLEASPGQIAHKTLS